MPAFKSSSSELKFDPLMFISPYSSRREIEDSRSPSFLRSFAAEMFINNIVASEFASTDRYGLIDINHDPWEQDAEGNFVHLQGVEAFPEEFVTSLGLKHTNRIREGILLEIERRKILEETGFFTRLFTGGIAEFADPLVFIPMIGIAKVGKGAISATRLGIASAGVFASAELGREVLFHANQATRTVGESAARITIASLLAGIGEAGFKKLSIRKAKKRALAKNIDDDFRLPKSSQRDPLEPGGLQVKEIRETSTVPEEQLVKEGPGAQNTHEVVRPEGEENILDEATRGKIRGKTVLRVPKPLRALNKLISPRFAVAVSNSPIVRRTGELLAQLPVLAKGVISADAESITRQWRAKTAENIRIARKFYSQYAKRAGAEKITSESFMQEISRAMRNGDQHAIPEVAKAAKHARKELIEPLRAMAVDLGLLPKNMSKNQIDNYLTRIYNSQKLRSVGQKDEFIDAISIYFHGQQGMELSLARKEAEAVYDQILSVVEGRSSPLLRGPLRERTLNVPDKVIEPWLVNDFERIISYYTRSMSSDIEITRRFGIVAAAKRMELTQSSTAQAVLSAESIDDAIEVLAKRDLEIGKRVPSDRFKKTLETGAGPERGLPEVMSRKELANTIRKSGNIDDAIAILESRDLRIKDRFHGANMEITLDNIKDEYEKRILEANKANDLRLVKRLQKDRDLDIRNIELMRDMIRGTLGVPPDPFAFTPRALRGLRQLTYLSIGGGVFLSSLSEPLILAMNHGLRNVFKDGFVPFFNSLKKAKMSIGELKDLGIAVETLHYSTAINRHDIDDAFIPVTRFESGLNKATHIYSIANLMQPWTKFIKQLNALTTVGKINRASRELLSSGKLNSRVEKELAEIGIGKDMLKRIGRQVKKHAPDPKGESLFFVNLKNWDDAAAKRSAESALLKSEGLNVLTSTAADRPVTGLSEEANKVLFMFRNFGLSSTTRIMTRGIQYGDAKVMSALLFNFGVSGMIVHLKALSAGREPPQTEREWIDQIIRRTEFSGVLFDIDNVLDQATQGKASIHAAISGQGKGIGAGRYTPPGGIFSALFGPAWYQVVAAANVASDTIDADVTPNSIRSFRRMIPANNLFMIDRIFKEVEGKVAESVSEQQ